ncbi:MAG: hypothetical protein J5671_08220 [Bacteroidaceae bacterium]|nr:hypothetical protein [Bacteroidaceae bacterium]
MRTFLRFLMLATFLTFFGVEASAQTKNVYIYSKNPKTNKESGVEGIYVYSCYMKSQADKVLQKLNDFKEDNISSDEYVDFQITEVSGSIVIKIPVNGYLLIYDYKNGQYETINRQVTNAEIRSDEIRIQLKLSNSAGESAEAEMSADLDETVVSAYTSTRRRRLTANASSCGGVLVVGPHPIIIDSIYARNNARFVISPVVVSRHNPNDTIGYLAPRFLDGIDYDPSQVRFMGFDKTHDKYWQNVSVMGDEPSANYFNTGMKTREEDTIYFHCKIRPYNDKKPWKIIGHYWYEDYNTIYYENNILIYAGYTQSPTHFLEWKESVPKEDLDDKRYSIRGTVTSVPHENTLKLDFENGKATLNYNDSLTYYSIEALKRSIRASQSDTSYVSGISIHGYASPEGRETGNKDLAQKRAQTVGNICSSEVRNLYADIKSDIVPWTEVADTLEAINAEGYAEIAQDIRNVCTEKSTLDDQGNIINKKPYFRILKEDKILDRMRRVKVTVNVVEDRVLDADEIYQRFVEKREDWLNGTIKEVAPYQFYQLMVRLNKEKDWDALYAVSKAAYNSSNQKMKEQTTRSVYTGERDPEDSTKFFTEERIPVERAYPLAAYYLAKSEIEKGIMDTLTLKNYLDTVANNGRYKEKVGQKHWNEEAIAVKQILMYCMAEKYKEAHILSQYHLPENDRYRKFQNFIKFLSCEYTEDEKEVMRKDIESTGAINYVVANLIDGEKGFRRAKDKLINNKRQFMKADTLDATYYYLLAICLYQVDCKEKDYETYYYNSKNVYDPHNDIAESQHWGMPMLEALKLDPKWAEFLKEDGFFNDAYRAMILFFWRRMQDGEEMENIAREYDELAKKYFSDKK